MDKNGQNEEKDFGNCDEVISESIGSCDTRVSMSKSSYFGLQYLEGPELKIIIIFYFTCTTCTPTCITLVTLLPQPVTTRTHACTNSRCLRYIPSHMYNTPRQQHTTSPSSLGDYLVTLAWVISHYLAYMRIQSQKHFLGGYNKVFVPFHCFAQAGTTVE